MDLLLYLGQASDDFLTELDERNGDIAPVVRLLVLLDVVNGDKERIGSFHHAVAESHVPRAGLGVPVCPNLSNINFVRGLLLKVSQPGGACFTDLAFRAILHR